jgi:hypothetical protein
MNEADIYIICPRCGEKVHYELNRCPECGLDFYPEGEEQYTEKTPSTSRWLIAISGLLLSFLASGIITFAIHLLMGQIFTIGTLNSTGQVILFLAGPLGAFAGGYVVSALLKRRAYYFGLATGMFTIPLTMILDTHWQSVTLASIYSFNSLSNMIVTLFCGLAGCHLYNWMQGGWNLPEWGQPGEKKLYQNLLVKARFDSDRVDRLIDYEKRRNPQGNRTEHIKSAIERWERDNR